MLKPLSLFIGWRYIRSKRRNGFLSFISLFTFIAMALGVAVLIIVLSVMNGFEREIRQRLLMVVPHLTVQGLVSAEQGRQASDMLDALPQVKRVAPYVTGYGMVAAFGRSQALKIQGVEPSRSMFDLTGSLVAGSIEQLEEGSFGIVLGEIAARRLGVMPGDTLRLTLPQASVTPVGLFPRERRMMVVGIFRVGADVDATHAFVHIRDAARLYRVAEDIQGLQLQLYAPMAPASVVAEVEGLNDGWEVSSWEREQATLFQAMRMEKIVVSLLLTIIILVAAFNIIANLVLLVADKRKDIAVLRTLGCGAGVIMSIFMVQGISLGLSGIAAGALLGFVIAWWMGDLVAALERLFGFELFDASVYFVHQLPSDPRLADVILVVLIALSLSIVATLYPAWRASRVHPAEVLRYHQ